MSFVQVSRTADGPFAKPDVNNDGSYDEGYDDGYTDGLAGGGGGGGGSAEWKTITEWGALYDPSSRVASSSVDATTGIFHFTMAGDTTIYDGFQEAAPRRFINFSDIDELSDFDPAVEDLEVLLEPYQLPTAGSPPQYGIGIVLADRNDVANQAGIGVNLRASGLTVQSTHIISASSASGSPSNQFQPVAGLRILFTFYQGATFNWIPFCVIKANNGNYETLGPTNLGTGTQMLTTINTWQLQLGIFHNNTTTGTPTFRGRVHVRRLARSTKFPTNTPAAKPSSGTFTAVCLGDSLMRGYTDSQTPPTGEAGEAIPGTISFYESGVGPAANWPSTLGNSPNPGYLQAFASAALAAGFSSVVLRRWAANGRDLDAMMSTELLDAREELNNANIDPGTVNAVLIAIGTNDTDNSTESAAFAARLERALEGIERWFYNARIILFEPPVVAASRPEVTVVNAALAAAVAANSRRALVAGNGHATIDSFHPTGAVYQTDGAAAFTAWQSTT